MNETEHPAKRAARLIRDMHVKTIEMIDEGCVFVHTDDDGGCSDVSLKIREKCVEQVAACEEIMARANGMSEELTEQAQEIFTELTTVLQPAVDHVQNEELPELPDFGSYDHKETKH